MSEELDEIRTRWSEVSGGPGAATAYQRRFDDLAASGTDIHGEARFVSGLIQPPHRVLDAGCGTGRVAIQLGRMGFHCTGVDADARMIDVAKDLAPGTDWVRADLSTLQLRGQSFDLVLLAGNVVPLLAEGTLGQTVERLAAHTQAGGYVVAGFGLEEAHLPPSCPVTSLAEYDTAARVAGLSYVTRFSTWDRDPWTAGGGYAVTVHRKQ